MLSLSDVFHFEPEYEKNNKAYEAFKKSVLGDLAVDGSEMVLEAEVGACLPSFLPSCLPVCLPASTPAYLPACLPWERASAVCSP